MRKNKLFLIIAISASFLSGCSVLQPLPAAKNISILQKSQVESCIHLADTHVKTLNKVGIFYRNSRDMQEELLILAKNQAVELKGNAIVQISPMENGETDFAIYHCMPNQ